MVLAIVKACALVALLQGEMMSIEFIYACFD
jgi:hypothetical protein